MTDGKMSGSMELLAETKIVKVKNSKRVMKYSKKGGITVGSLKSCERKLRALFALFPCSFI